MLRDYPVKINGTKIPEAEKWDESYETVETTNQSEAGTDIVVLVRSDKLTVSCEYNCSSFWAAKFAAFRDAEPLTVQIYDILTGDYSTHTMRMRSFSASSVENSGSTRNTNGLWTVSFELKDY